MYVCVALGLPFDHGQLLWPTIPSVEIKERKYLVLYIYHEACLQIYTYHDDAAPKVVREIDSLTHLSTYHTKQKGTCKTAKT